ncbi:Uncharacterized protein TPAR_04020, partial [Tolypocladium paradoxum]
CGFVTSRLTYKACVSLTHSGFCVLAGSPFPCRTGLPRTVYLSDELLSAHLPDLALPCSRSRVRSRGTWQFLQVGINKRFLVSPNPLLLLLHICRHTRPHISHRPTVRATDAELGHFLHPKHLQPPQQPTATMAGPYNVQVHQASRGASVGSSYTASYASSSPSSSSAASSPRSGSPGTYRVYGAGNHTAKKAQPSSAVDVVQYGTTGYQSGSPSPGYGGAYSRK